MGRLTARLQNEYCVESGSKQQASRPHLPSDPFRSGACSHRQQAEEINAKALQEFNIEKAKVVKAEKEKIMQELGLHRW